MRKLEYDRAEWNLYGDVYLSNQNFLLNKKFDIFLQKILISYSVERGRAPMSQQSKPKNGERIAEEQQNKSITFGFLVRRITPVASGPPTKGRFILRLLGRNFLWIDHLFLGFLPKLTGITFQQQAVALLVVNGGTPTHLAWIYFCNQIKTTVNEIVRRVNLGNRATERCVSRGIRVVFL